MTDHPITPSPELTEQWAYMLGVRPAAEVLTAAARWGADQELKACCEWLRWQNARHSDLIPSLRFARRPKPPSLKEQALDSWDRLRNEAWCQEIDLDLDTIRHALEALPND